jgi:hypothetical protein
MEFQKWIGREVEMIYEDAKGCFSRRLVRVQSFSGKHLLAFDLAKRQPRKFRTDGILAMMPAARRAV